MFFNLMFYRTRLKIWVSILKRQCEIFFKYSMVFPRGRDLSEECRDFERILGFWKSVRSLQDF
jgi:hypothetical protein